MTADNTHERQTRAVEQRLREAGLKLTAQRLAIVRCLVGDERHPTAQELFERLRPAFPTMSFATVYNTLGALTSVGACQHVQLGGATRFDPNGHPHDHVVCDRCGVVRDVHAARESAGRVADVCAVDGFQIHRVERVYRGLCASCRNARTTTQDTHFERE